MKVVCRHGYFSFYPGTEVDVWRFMRIFKRKLISQYNYFTFESLAGLPRYSLTAQIFGNLPALVTYEGRHASEVMRENGFVYDMRTGLLSPSITITSLMKLPQSLDYAVAPSPLVQPGSIMPNGQRINSFIGELNLDQQRLYVSEWGAT